jgi:hypothetical protein
VCVLFAFVCIFSLSHSRGSICARTLAFSLGQDVEKSIAMHVHGDRERLYSTHYIFIYLTLKGSTDCAAARASEGVRSAAHTDAGISIMLCFQLETALQGDKVGGYVIVPVLFVWRPLGQCACCKEMRFQPILYGEINVECARLRIFYLKKAQDLCHESSLVCCCWPNFVESNFLMHIMALAQHMRRGPKRSYQLY